MPTTLLHAAATPNTRSRATPTPVATPITARRLSVSVPVLSTATVATRPKTSNAARPDHNAVPGSPPTATTGTENPNAHGGAATNTTKARSIPSRTTLARTGAKPSSAATPAAYAQPRTPQALTAAIVIRVPTPTLPRTEQHGVLRTNAHTPLPVLQYTTPAAPPREHSPSRRHTPRRNAAPRAYHSFSRVHARPSPRTRTPHSPHASATASSPP